MCNIGEGLVAAVTEDVTASVTKSVTESVTAIVTKSVEDKERMRMLKLLMRKFGLGLEEAMDCAEYTDEEKKYYGALMAKA